MDPTSDPSHDPIEALLADANQPTTSSMSEGQGDESTASGPVKTKDSMQLVVDELKKDVTEPNATVEDGMAPAPFIVGFEPSAKYPDQRDAFSQLLGMAGITRMFAALNVVSARGARKQTEPYSLSKPNEYVSAFNEGTDATIKALTVGPLAGFYDATLGGSTQTEEILVKRSELHDFVLQRIFSGLVPVGKQQMDHLDNVLTDFVASLKSYKCTPTADQPTLNHVVLVNHIKATDISGGGNVFVIDPYTRMVCLTITAGEWAVALQKPGFLKRNEKIKFGMTTTITELKLDKAKYTANKGRYEQALKVMVGDQDDLKKITDNGGVEAFGRETSLVLSAQEASDATDD
ncbi:hypothetical protein ACHAPT_009465 [Fusarium lateritium]